MLQHLRNCCDIIIILLSVRTSKRFLDLWLNQWCALGRSNRPQCLSWCRPRYNAGCIMISCRLHYDHMQPAHDTIAFTVSMLKMWPRFGRRGSSAGCRHHQGSRSSVRQTTTHHNRCPSHLWLLDDSFKTVEVCCITDWFTWVFHQWPSCLQRQTTYSPTLQKWTCYIYCLPNAINNNGQIKQSELLPSMLLFSLPDSIKLTTDMKRFKNLFKTHLFHLPLWHLC